MSMCNGVHARAQCIASLLVAGNQWFTRFFLGEVGGLVGVAGDVEAEEGILWGLDGGADGVVLAEVEFAVLGVYLLDIALFIAFDALPDGEDGVEEWGESAVSAE